MTVVFIKGGNLDTEKDIRHICMQRDDHVSDHLVRRWSPIRHGERHQEKPNLMSL